MGNQLAGLSPQPVVNVEDYISELSGLIRFEEQLCGSRLFKVAKIRKIDDHSSRMLLVKIFPSPSVSQLIWHYQILMRPYCHQVPDGHNLLFFNMSYITDRCGVLIRDFIDHSLADRLCTRPFLCIEDKRWIAYQLLCSLTQLHSMQNKSDDGQSLPLCHGDIKAENVLVTSWGWVLLADPAPFKPIWLPADNPSEFTHFFDSSRRRVCYLAPERFVELQPTSSSRDMSKTPESHIMDASSCITTIVDHKECVHAQAVTATTPRSDHRGCKNTMDHTVHNLQQDTLTEETIVTLITSNKQDITGLPDEIGTDNTTDIPFDRQTTKTIPSFESSSIGNDDDDNALEEEDDDDDDEDGNRVDGGVGCTPHSNTSELINSEVKFQPEQLISSNMLKFGNRLTPSMDLFSLGCVLLELFTDGSIAFTLADLLAYRRNDDVSRVNKLLEQVPCEHAKSLISLLLSLHNKKRGTAVEHLKEQCDKAFPKVFYSHLMQYLKNFLHPSLCIPDSRIAFLKWTLNDFLTEISSLDKESLSVVAVVICNLIISALRPIALSQNNQTPCTAADLPVPKSNNKVDDFLHNINNNDKNDLFNAQLHKSEQLDYVGNSSKRLSEQGKVQALLCLLEIAPHMHPGLLLDRVIPYCVELTTNTSTTVNAHSAEVRSLAIDILTNIFSQVTSKCEDFTDCNTFLEETFLTEYLFPSLIPLSIDPKPEVRLALARCLPILSECSMQFLTITTRLRVKNATFSDERKQSTDSQTSLRHQSSSACSTKLAIGLPNSQLLSSLRLHVQDRLVTLFSDPNPHIRLALMNTSSVSKLASFFGRSRTSGTLLSHMITFLNDKAEPGLRAAFFRQVSLLASLIGAQSVTVLRSLLEQGLVDPDELVLETCIRSLTHLLRRRLLSAPIAIGFLTQTLALTAYPTMRIRQATVSYISGFARLALNFQTKCDKKSTNNNNQSRICGTVKSSHSHISGQSVHQFWPGICSPASVYARLVNNETKKTVFCRPVEYCFTSDTVLLGSLCPPISRCIIEALVFMPISLTRSPMVSTFSGISLNAANQESTATQIKIERVSKLLKLLQERKSARSVTRRDETPCYISSDDEVIDSLFNRLKSLGLTELMESQLVNLSNLILSMCRNCYRMPGRTQLTNSSIKSSQSALAAYKVYSLDKHRFVPHKRNSIPTNPKDVLTDLSHLQSLIQSPLQRYANILYERLLFGKLPLQWLFFGNSNLFIANRSLLLSPNTVSIIPPSAISNQTNLNVSERLEVTSTNATSNLNKLCLLNGDLLPVQNDTTCSLLGRSLESKSMFDYQSEAPIWPESRPQGIMIAHLHEHRAGVISLAAHNSGRLLVSCSSGDGTVKLWNCGFCPTESDGYLDQTGNQLVPYSARINSSIANTLETGGRSLTQSRNCELAQSYCLPTRSSWTFHTIDQESKPTSVNKSCRGIAWATNGSSVVTIVDRNYLCHIDAASGQLLNNIQLTNSSSLGQAICLTTSACCNFVNQFNLTQSLFDSGSDANLIAYATTGNQILARDLRTSSSNKPVWKLKQDHAHGLIRSMAMRSCHTWLVSGTSRGHLVCWDLRYHRPVAYTEHPYEQAISILNLQIVETQSINLNLDSLCNSESGRNGIYQTGQTLIVAATDHHNGITIWDLEASATASSAAALTATRGPLNSSTFTQGIGCIAATWAQPGNLTPLVLDPSLPHYAVRALLCLSSKLPGAPDSQFAHLPTIITGGNDSRLRCWEFAQPKASRVISWSGNEEALPPKFDYRSIETNNVYVLMEQLFPHHSQSTADCTSVLTKQTQRNATRSLPTTNQPTPFPTSGRLELREATIGHKNIISDLSMLQAGQAYLVSSSMDGIIKIWK